MATTTSLRSANYRIDFTKMTLTMTADFALKAYDPTTEEYEILTRLQRDFPRLRVVRKTHRSPKTANPIQILKRTDSCGLSVLFAKMAEFLQPP